VAVGVYERLLAANAGAPDDLLMRIGKAAKSGGDTTKSAAAYARVYYEFPLSDFAPAAGFEVLHSPALELLAYGSHRYTLELARAERLFTAKQYVPAHAAFDLLRAAAQGDDSELVRLQCGATISRSTRAWRAGSARSSTMRRARERRSTSTPSHRST
jgi:hypothetical protein